MDRDKQTSSAYDIKDKENTSSTYENKEKARDDYVSMYDWCKPLCTSTFEHMCTAK